MVLLLFPNDSLKHARTETSVDVLKLGAFI